MVDLRRFFFQIHQDYSKDTVVASADVLTVLCVRRVLQMPSDMLIYVRWGHVFFSAWIYFNRKSFSNLQTGLCGGHLDSTEENNSISCKRDIILEKKEKKIPAK